MINTRRFSQYVVISTWDPYTFRGFQTRPDAISRNNRFRLRRFRAMYYYYSISVADPRRLDGKGNKTKYKPTAPSRILKNISYRLTRTRVSTLRRFDEPPIVARLIRPLNNKYAYTRQTIRIDQSSFSDTHAVCPVHNRYSYSFIIDRTIS